MFWLTPYANDAVRRWLLEYAGVILGQFTSKVYQRTNLLVVADSEIDKIFSNKGEGSIEIEMSKRRSSFVIIHGNQIQIKTKNHLGLLSYLPKSLNINCLAKQSEI